MRCMKSRNSSRLSPLRPSGRTSNGMATSRGSAFHLLGTRCQRGQSSTAKLAETYRNRQRDAMCADCAQGSPMAAHRADTPSHACDDDNCDVLLGCSHGRDTWPPPSPMPTHFSKTHTDRATRTDILIRPRSRCLQNEFSLSPSVPQEPYRPRAVYSRGQSRFQHELVRSRRG